MLDFMNFIDFSVVFIDLFFIYVEQRGDGGGGGSRSGGLIKALRLARAARLFRLIRIRKLLAVSSKNMSVEEAMTDPRAVPIKFEMLLGRMVRYLRDNSLNTEKTETLGTVMHVLNLHVGRAHKLLNPTMLEEAALIEDTNVQDLLLRKKAEFEQIQMHIGIDCECVEVLLEAISHTKSLGVREDAIDTLRNLLLGGNKNIQAACVDTLTDSGSRSIGAAFFFKVRDLLRDNVTKLKEYRIVRKMNPVRAESLGGDLLSCLKIMKLMKEMCEGHYSPLQNLLRKQPHAKSTNLVEETMDLFCIVAKNLASVRQWDDVEANVGNEAMTLMIELSQGPCRENQQTFAENAKMIDGCLCVVTANLQSVKDARLKLQLESSCMVLLSSLMENGTPEVIMAIKDLVPVAILDDRADKVARKLDWLGSMGATFRDEFIEVLNAEAQSIMTLKQAFEENDEESGIMQGVGEADDGSEDDGGEEGGEGRKKGTEKEKSGLALRNVEVFWHGRCQKVFFNAALDSLSSSSKVRFMDECDLSSQEARVKEMIQACDDLEDEMEYFLKMKDFRVFQMFTRNFLTIKR